MKTLVGVSPRYQMLLRWAGWALLIVLLLVSLRFLVNVVNHGMDWITGLFPHSSRSWEARLWLF
jgi:hypothetical protein